MRLLLDTHIAIWAVNSPSSLPASTAEMIVSADNDVTVSNTSLWEIAIKNALDRPGKGAIGVSMSAALDAFQTAGFEMLAIDVKHIAGVERLPRLHGDPFDRLLVATAIADTLRLVTNDRALAAYGDHVLLV